MLEQKYRKYYEKIFINPVLKYAANISPIAITLVASIVGILIIPAIYFDYKWSAVFLLLFSGYLDTLDGSVARYYGKATKLGSVLDIVLDRVVEGAVLLGFLITDPSHALLCFLMLFSNLICVTSFLVIGVFSIEASAKSFFYHNGLVERAEAFIFYILMILLPHLFIVFASIYVLVVLFSAFLHIKFFYNNVEPE